MKSEEAHISLTQMGKEGRDWRKRGAMWCHCRTLGTSVVFGDYKKKIFFN